MFDSSLKACLTGAPVSRLCLSLPSRGEPIVAPYTPPRAVTTTGRLPHRCTGNHGCVFLCRLCLALSLRGEPMVVQYTPARAVYKHHTPMHDSTIDVQLAGRQTCVKILNVQRIFGCPSASAFVCFAVAARNITNPYPRLPSSL